MPGPRRGARSMSKRARSFGAADEGMMDDGDQSEEMAMAGPGPLKTQLVALVHFSALTLRLFNLVGRVGWSYSWGFSDKTVT